MVRIERPQFSPDRVSATLLDQIQYEHGLEIAFSPNGFSDSVKRALMFRAIDDDSYWQVTVSTPVNDSDDFVEVTNPLSVYFSEMRRYRLLTQPEEVGLTKLIAEGRNTADPEIVHYAQQAREVVIRANTRLAVYMAKKYRGYGIDFPDLIQDANIGVVKAIDRFDPDRGVKFSTYARWWVRQSITREMGKNSREIRLPINVGEDVRALNRTAKELFQVLEREPTPEEIAQEIGWSEEKVIQLQIMSILPISLDKALKYDEDEDLYSVVDAGVSFTEKIDLDIDLVRAIKKAGLTKREYFIVYAKLIDDEINLSELGDILGISRERVRQLYSNAKIKLKRHLK